MINVSLFTVRRRSCGKVMFSIASVSSHGLGEGRYAWSQVPSRGGVDKPGACLVHPFRKYTSQKVHSLGRYTPGRYNPWSWHLLVATEVDIMHYTGMLSCELNYEKNRWRIYPKGCCEETTSPAFCKKSFHFHKENGKNWLSSPPPEICTANPGVAFWLAQYTTTIPLVNM